MGISALLASQILDASATGRSVITGADASAIRTTLGLGTLATQSPTGTPSASTFLRGDYSWQTIDLSGYLTLTGGTMTGRLQTPSILLAGNFSATAWTTSGVGLSHTARTLTDTSSTGTVATAYTNVLGGNTIAASNATTFTDYASLFLGSPSAGSNVTITNPFSLITQGAVRIGGQLSLIQGTANTSVLTSTGYSLTGSNAQSLIDVSGTWNTTGTPTLLKANVTDTASNANSLLMDLQVGGTSRFTVGKNGSTRLIGVSGTATDVFGVSRASSSGVGNLFRCRSDSTFDNAGFVSILTDLNFEKYGDSVWLSALANSNYRQWQINTSYTNTFLKFSSDARLEWYGATERADTNTSDLVLRRDAAGTLAQRNGLNPQVHRVYNTYTDSSNYERAKIAWESNVLRIGTEKAGTGSARALELQTDGVTRLTIGATGLFTIADALNIAVGTTTGTKIGTATTQKLGFWNATPIEQPTTAVGSATVASPGGGSTIKTDDTFDGYTIQQVVKALRNFGLLA